MSLPNTLINLVRESGEEWAVCCLSAAALRFLDSTKLVKGKALLTPENTKTHCETCKFEK